MTQADQTLDESALTPRETLSPFLPGTNIQYACSEEETIAAWLIKKSTVNNGCWDCHLEPNQKGYSNVQIGGREGVKWRAHVLICAVVHGPAPSPFNIVRHTCDNRRCIRPHHLIYGTHGENTQDMMSRGRHKYIIPDNQKITTENMKEILSMREAGLSYKSIGEHFNVTASTIMNNIRKHING